jgi:beta-glucosidase/6-phospho-beta-glucosidase/beta-galactosidase
LTHFHDGAISDNSTGDVAADSYNKYLDDIACLKETGVRLFIRIPLVLILYIYIYIYIVQVNFYRFSLSWSRILPTGRIDQINQAGIAYYNNLIDALITNEITPLVKQASTKLNKLTHAKF